jgi:hypothetical protein
MALCAGFSLLCICSAVASSFEPLRQAQPKQHSQQKKKKFRTRAVKKPDASNLQAQAEANIKHNQNEMHLRQFQQMQQAQQRGYQQQIQSQQGDQSTN